MGSLDGIRLASSYGLFWRRTDDQSLGAYGGEAVDVRTDVQLDDIALGEGLGREGVGLEGGEVGDTVVDRNRRWEAEA